MKPHSLFAVQYMTPPHNKRHPPISQQCEHIGLFVFDLEKMSRFYVKKLGFKITRDYLVDKKMIKDIFAVHSSCRIRLLYRDRFGMELFYFLDTPLQKKQRCTSGYDHWTLVVEDKDRFCAKLKAKGIKVIKIIKPHGFTYFIKDPENNLIEVKSHQLTADAKTGY